MMGISVDFVVYSEFCHSPRLWMQPYKYSALVGIVYEGASHAKSKICAQDQVSVLMLVIH